MTAALSDDEFEGMVARYDADRAAGLIRQPQARLWLLPGREPFTAPASLTTEQAIARYDSLAAGVHHDDNESEFQIRLDAALRTDAPLPVEGVDKWPAPLTFNTRLQLIRAIREHLVPSAREYANLESYADEALLAAYRVLIDYGLVSHIPGVTDTAERTDMTDDDAAARQRMIERNATAWTRPIGESVESSAELERKRAAALRQTHYAQERERLHRERPYEPPPEPDPARERMIARNRALNSQIRTEEERFKLAKEWEQKDLEAKAGLR